MKRIVARQGLPFYEPGDMKLGPLVDGFPDLLPTDQLTDEILEKLTSKSHRVLYERNGVITSEVNSRKHGIIQIRHLP